MIVAYVCFAFAAMLLEAAFGWGSGQARRRTLNACLGAAAICALSMAVLILPPSPAPLIRLDGAWWRGTWGVVCGAALHIASYDLLYTCWHRAQHAVPALWTIHSVHHADTEFDASTYLRQHWLESILQRFLLALPLGWIVGIPDSSTLAAAIFAAAFDMWTHIGIPVELGPLTRVVTGPQLHRHHHAADPSVSKGNYAAYLPLWDLIMGTYVHPAAGAFPRTGLWNVVERREARRRPRIVDLCLQAVMLVPRTGFEPAISRVKVGRPDR